MLYNWNTVCNMNILILFSTFIPLLAIDFQHLYGWCDLARAGERYFSFGVLYAQLLCTYCEVRRQALNTGTSTPLIYRLSTATTPGTRPEKEGRAAFWPLFGGGFHSAVRSPFGPHKTVPLDRRQRKKREAKETSHRKALCITNSIRAIHRKIKSTCRLLSFSTQRPSLECVTMLSSTPN